MKYCTFLNHGFVSFNSNWKKETIQFFLYIYWFNLLRNFTFVNIIIYFHCFGERKNEIHFGKASNLIDFFFEIISHLNYPGGKICFLFFSKPEVIKKLFTFPIFLIKAKILLFPPTSICYKWNVKSAKIYAMKLL